MDFLCPVLQRGCLGCGEDVTENEVAVFGEEGVLRGCDCVCHREMGGEVGASW